MGNCCAQKDDVDISDVEEKEEQNGPGNMDDDKIQSPEARKLEAKKQRRRLSVAPGQVGDISPMKRMKKRRQSLVGLQHIPTAAPKKFVAISKKGYVPYNKNKVNQDSYFCNYSIDDNNCRLFGVCDGHGEYGHHVSQLVAKKLPKYIKQCQYQKEPEKAIQDATMKMVETLRKSDINTTFSGTTLVFSLIVNGICYTANVGDSRAVIVSRNPQTGEIVAKPLSIDHKCDIPEESDRILQSGGRVAPLPGPPGEDPGPNRVWLADIDVPGLAMSRSLGDDVAHSVGVSSAPEIIKHTLDKQNDLFLMYASDGIWEFISNEQAAEIVLDKLPDLREAALKLVKDAIAKWRDEEEVIDDITAVIYNLSQEHDDEAENKSEKPQEEDENQDKNESERKNEDDNENKNDESDNVDEVKEEKESDKNQE